MINTKINTKINLYKQYLHNGYFDKCIDILNTIDIFELEDNEAISCITMGLEATVARGNIDKEKFFLEILLDRVGQNDIVYLYYMVSYYTRTDANKAQEAADKLLFALSNDNKEVYFKYYLLCITAYFYAGNVSKALEIISLVNNLYAQYISSNIQEKTRYYHTIGLIYHNLDKNKYIVTKGKEAVDGYKAIGDIYNSLIERVNVADAQMAVGNLLEAEQALKDIYIDAKRSCWKHAYNIASICYANALTSLGKASIALIYYEEGIRLSVEINHNWDELYGKIWRTLALADFHDYSSLDLVEEYKKEAKEKGYDYLIQLATAFQIIEGYLLNNVVEAEQLINNLENIDSISVPGLKLEAICAALLRNPFEKLIEEKYIKEIYSLISKCEGAKGRPNLIMTLYTTRRDIFTDEEKNVLVEKWIEEYVSPYLQGFSKVEEMLFKDLPERPLVKPCDMQKCTGYCCYDGVYLQPEEEVKIKDFIKENRDIFRLKSKDYFMDGNWKDIVKGRKTGIKACEYAEDFPKHFNQTKCIFANEKGLCMLQLVCTRKSLHPWKVKPMSCWLFPLDMEDDKIIPPPKKGEKDRMYVDQSYPGYITCLHCGQETEQGVSWKILFKQELLYYYFLKQQQELGID